MAALDDVTDLATTEEALAGEADDKWMSPLKVREAITAYLNDKLVIGPDEPDDEDALWIDTNDHNPILRKKKWGSWVPVS